jgi:hypothetical protein
MWHPVSRTMSTKEQARRHRLGAAGAVRAVRAVCSLGCLSLLGALLFTGVGHADPVRYPTNGHYYEAVSVPEGISWEAANAAANASTFNAMHGHLATITTLAENQFLTSRFSSATSRG